MARPTYMTPFEAVDIRQHDASHELSADDRIALSYRNRADRLVDMMTVWMVHIGIGILLAFLLGAIIIAVMVGINYAQSSDQSLITIVLNKLGRGV